LTGHTNDADCGDNIESTDGKRLIWDIWNYSTEHPGSIYPSYYHY
jgi:hypothetical protein